jgi:hypothetical protein
MRLLFQSVLRSANDTTRTTAGGSQISDELADGDGVDEADQVWESLNRALADGAAETLDLSGSLENEQGETVAFTKVKGILIHNKSTVATSILSVGAAASNQFVAPFGDASDLVKVRPGGLLFLWAPDATAYACAAGSTDNLKIANAAGGAAVYDIRIVGVKA